MRNGIKTYVQNEVLLTETNYQVLDRGLHAENHTKVWGSDYGAFNFARMPLLISGRAGLCKPQVASSNLVEGLWGINQLVEHLLCKQLSEFESPILHNGLATSVLTFPREKRIGATTHVRERWDPSWCPLC